MPHLYLQGDASPQQLKPQNQMKLITAIMSAAVFYAVISQPYAEQPTVVASWYGDKYAGRPTASGEIFDPTQLTAAMWDVPFGTKVKVQLGPKSVVVRINDRGPAKHLNRGIDLSREAFSRLADTDAGLLNVKLTILK
jgi:rare lipoprotein A